MKSGRLISIAFLLFLSIFTKGQNQGTDTIPWSDDIRLTWNDFKGIPNESFSFLAFTDYVIKFKYNYVSTDGINIRLCSYMDRNKSWVKKGKENDSLLMHEKGHFAIAEIYARIARKAIADTILHPSDINTILGTIYLRVMRECDKQEAQYDLETNHSIRTSKQIEWLRKIYAELEELKDYSNPDVFKKIQ